MRTKKKGITLIELMIAMALSAIVAGTIVFIVATAKRLMVGGLSVIDATQQNQQILGRIKKELEGANKIYSAEAPYIAVYEKGYSIQPLAASVESKATSENPEDLPWQVPDSVNGPFWKGIKDNMVVYYWSRTPQGVGAVYREVRSGYNPSTLLQGPTVISDPNIEVDHLKFTYFNYTMQFPEYLPFRYSGSTVWYQGGAVYTQYAQIPPYTRNVKVVISPGNYPQDIWKTLSGTREDPLQLAADSTPTTLKMESRTVSPTQVWWDDDLPAGASWNSYADTFLICGPNMGVCSSDDAVVNGPDGRQNVAGTAGLVWRSIPNDEPWAYSGLKFDSGAMLMSYSHTEDYVPDYPDPYLKIHMHYFTGGAVFPSAGPFADNDDTTIFVHAYVNPSPIDFTREIMLMFHCNDASHCTQADRNQLSYWKHRAFWTGKEFLRFDNDNSKDENGSGSTIDDGLIPWGVNGVSRAYMGEVPEAGQWVVLGIPVKKAGVNLNNRQITGMAFALYGGQVYWDKTSYGTWGAWNDTPGAVAAPGPFNNNAIPVALANNYYQWRAEMERPASDETVTPVLQDVTINYGTNATFQSAAFPQVTTYSTSQNWVLTTEMDFNHSKEKKSTSVNGDGTVTLARPKCFQFQVTNRLAYDLMNYPVVVSANTFNEVLNNDMRGDGNDVRVYRKQDYDKKCILYPSTTANLPAPAGCSGTETAFKISGRQFGTGQTNVAFIDNTLKDDLATPGVNEGQKDYYMCYGNLLDDVGYWVLPANHTLAVAGTAVNEPYLPPTRFNATVSACTNFWGCIGTALINLLSAIASLNLPGIVSAWDDMVACVSCWFSSSIPAMHPTNPRFYSYNFGGVPFSGYTNTYYDPTGATKQYVFSSYGGLTRYNDYKYDLNDAVSEMPDPASIPPSYREDIAGIYHFFDEPEDTLGSIPNIGGHILPHAIYDVATGKYYYIATAGGMGGWDPIYPGSHLFIQCDASTVYDVPTVGGTNAVCGAAGSVTATLRNIGGGNAADAPPTWWEIVSDKPILGIQLNRVKADNAFSSNSKYNIPEDDPKTSETEDYYRGIIYHPGTYVLNGAGDRIQGLTPNPDTIPTPVMPANGGNIWAYSLGVYDNPSSYDYYKYFVDDIPQKLTPVSTKAGKWDEIPGSSWNYPIFATCDPSQTTNSGAVGLPWGTGSSSARLCCIGCRGSMAGWVWMDLGAGGQSFDRIEIQWGQSSPQTDQQIWAMPDNAAATACYASMINTGASTDGLMSGCAGAGATLLANSGFVKDGGATNCSFNYNSGMLCGFDMRFGSPAYYSLFLPIGTGNNSTYDSVIFSLPQTFRYVGIYGKTTGQSPVLALLQPAWATSVDFDDVRVWKNSATKGYELKPVGGVAKYEWWQAITRIGLGFFRWFAPNHGYAYYLNKPVSAGVAHTAAVKQMRKLEVGCFDYTMVPILGFFSYGCGVTVDRGILLGAGGAMYQPPLVTPAKPLGWLNPVTYGFTKYASDTAVGSSPSRAIDNDLGTYWQSLNNITAATQPKLWMDMGMDRKINMIDVYPEFSSGNGYRYNVSVAKSADCPLGCDNCPASAWVQVGVKGDMQPSSDGGDVFSFTPLTVRCIQEEFLDGTKGGSAGGAWWGSGTAGDIPAKVLEQEAYLAKYEKQGYYISPPFVGDSHRSWTVPFTKDAYDVRLHFVKFDAQTPDDHLTVWDTVTNNVLWAHIPNPPVTAAQINQTECTTGVGNTPGWCKPDGSECNSGDPGCSQCDPPTQFWTPWLRSCMNAAGTYNPALCKCYDETQPNTNASTKIPGQQVKLFWTGPKGYDTTKTGWVIDKYQIWGIINPALIQVEVMSCSGKGKSRRCVPTVTKVQPANLLYQTRLRSVMK